MTDRQLDRFAVARQAHRASLETLRRAQEDHDRALAELTTSASALAERVRLLDATTRAAGRRAA